MNTFEEPSVQPKNYKLLAGLAEARHVDGAYLNSAQSWEQLAAYRDIRGEALLKAAISYISIGNIQHGWDLLIKAGRIGVDSNEIEYVTGQIQLLQGRYELAINSFKKAITLAQDDNIAKARATNALGVLYWRCGLLSKAQMQFEFARSYNSDDPCTLINSASLIVKFGGDLSVAKGYLIRATSIAPHRYEPFVIWSRILRKENSSARLIRNALSSARLRKKTLDEPSKSANSKPSGLIADVTAKIEVSSVNIDVLFSASSLNTDIPQGVFVNTGYKSISINGELIKPKKIPQSEYPSVILKTLEYFEIRLNHWIKKDNIYKIRIIAQGIPNPPCARVSKHEIELDGLSGWLPILQPITYAKWNLNIDSELRSTFVTHPEGLALTPSILSINETSKREFPTKLVGSCTDVKLRLIQTSVSIAQNLWQNLLKRPIERIPPIVVVKNEKSHFCYARSGYIRISSGAIRKPVSPLIFHEIGHVLWGISTRFDSDSSWLCESLAEYTLHLAESEGHLPGYSRTTLYQLYKANNGRLPSEGLLKASKNEGKVSNYMLRVKGGFVIRSLRSVMGDQKFVHLLVETLNLEQQRELNFYDFFALASRIYGNSLNWFVNQWVFSDAKMEFSVSDYYLQNIGSKWKIILTATRCGDAIPGAPVTYLLKTEAGPIEFSVDLNLSCSSLEYTVESMPISVHPDPNHEWYAERKTVDISVVKK